MSIRTSQPPHLKRPMKVFGVTFIVFCLAVVGSFILTSNLLLESGEWHSLVASIPGVVMCGIFLIIYNYIRHNDELHRSITFRSLAVSAVIGISAHVVSITRASIGGYPEFGGATILVVMASAFIGVSAFLTWKHR